MEVDCGFFRRIYYTFCKHPISGSGSLPPKKILHSRRRGLEAQMQVPVLLRRFRGGFAFLEHHGTRCHELGINPVEVLPGNHDLICACVLNPRNGSNNSTTTQQLNNSTEGCRKNTVGRHHRRKKTNLARHHLWSMWHRTTSITASLAITSIFGAADHRRRDGRESERRVAKRVL